MGIEDLISGCKKGHNESIKQLYVNFGPTVKSICFRYIKQTDEASDTFHDCFIKIIHSVEKYNFNGSFEGWIKRVAVNFCLDKLKKKNVLIYCDEFEDSNFQIESEVDLLEDTSLFEEALKADFSKEDWKKMISKLPEHYSIVFCLFQIDGFSHAEIAKALTLDEKTSRSRLSKAKKKLREIIQEEIKPQLIEIGK